MNKEIPNIYGRIAVAVLLIVLVFLGYVLWRQYEHARYMQIVSDEHIQFSNLLHSRPLDADDASYIEPWMTFDYISLAFKVPAAYLKSDLNITDPHYPHISIGRYSKNAGENASAVVTQVRDAVQGYLAGTSTPVMPTTSTPLSE